MIQIVVVIHVDMAEFPYTLEIEYKCRIFILLRGLSLKNVTVLIGFNVPGSTTFCHTPNV